MEKELFIQQYTIAYVSKKMAVLNRNEVQPADLPVRYARTAISEAIEIFEHFFKK